jgi:hypothetical protein
MSKRLIDALGRTPEERAAWKKLSAEVNEEAAKNWGNPAWHQEMAAELTEVVQWGFEFTNLLDLFIEVERADFNGRVFLKEVQGLQAFWMARGGNIEQSTLTADVVEVPRETLGFHVSEFEDKLKTNFAETTQTLSSLAVTRLDAEVNKRLLALVQAAIPSNSSNYVAATGIQKATIDSSIRSVRDQSRMDQVTIIGRHTMTEQISDFPGFGWETQEEIRAKGVLGSYRGATIVTLKNFRENDFRLSGGSSKSYFPGNEMYVLAKDIGKWAFYGDMMSKEYTELDNWYWHYLGRQDSGALIPHPERARRIVDSTQSA